MIRSVRSVRWPEIRARALRKTDLGARMYVSQTQAKRNTVAVVPTVEGYTPPGMEAHLKLLSRRELLSLGLIGCVTVNSAMLQAAIWTFPYVPACMVKRLISSLYCGGDDMAQVRETGRSLRERGVRNMMLSLTIEDADGTKNIDIAYIVAQTVESLHKVLRPHMEEQLATAEDVNSIPPGYLALKPSALVANPSEVLLHFGDAAWREQREALVANCSRIAEEVFKLNAEFAARYPARKTPFFVATLDAEKYALQKAGVYELQRILFERFNPATSPMVSVVGTWQMYLRDAASDLERDHQRAEREGYRLGVKLVRGAYLHSEVDRSVIHPTKLATDECYNETMVKIIQDLLNKGERSTYGHLVVGSHNYQSQMLATMVLMSQESCIGKTNVVLGQLLGMSDNVTHDLVHKHGVKNIIKYVPWGPPKETKDYLLRRLQENGDAVRADNGWPLVKAVARTLLG